MSLHFARFAGPDRANQKNGRQQPWGSCECELSARLPSRRPGSPAPDRLLVGYTVVS